MNGRRCEDTLLVDTGEFKESVEVSVALFAFDDAILVKSNDVNFAVGVGVELFFGGPFLGVEGHPHINFPVGLCVSLLTCLFAVRKEEG